MTPVILGGSVDRHLDRGHSSGDLPAIERKSHYPLSRLTAAVDELNLLTYNQMPAAIERIIADLGNGEQTDAGIEAARRLRRWQADYGRLAVELEAAARSFRPMERTLRRQVDATLTDWERRFG